MTYKSVKLSDLKVNSANDRHGELPDEASAIAWLFNDKPKHMKNLASDITNQGRIYEPPLIYKRGSKYIVYDGNRRVTCLKLLSKPSNAPTVQLQEYFRGLNSQWTSDLPKEVTCQIETNLDEVDDILYRRHTGSKSGIGQTTWDDRMKRNFESRTGRGKGKTAADFIEEVLESADRLPRNRKIPRSTMNRLFSSEKFLNQVGISIIKGELKFTHDKNIVLSALQRVANDLSSKSVTLSDLWDSKRKNIYLKQLDNEGVLPTESDKIKNDIDEGPKPKPEPKPKPKPKTKNRKTLIPNVEYGIEWIGKTQRHREIWDELQFHLILDTHPNAISVLLRVLIELSVNHYIAETKLDSIYENDSLAKKISKIATHLVSNQRIDKDYKRDLQKLEQVENLISINTLNRYIHSFELSPSQNHLKAIWDSLATFVVHCLTVHQIVEDK